MNLKPFFLKLLSGPISKAIRHGLATLGGALIPTIGTGFGNLESVEGLVGGLLAFGASCAWSWAAKRYLPENLAIDPKPWIAEGAGIVAAQSVPAILGWAAAHGYTGPSEVVPMMLWGLNYLQSVSSRADGATGKAAVTPGKRVPLIVFPLVLGLSLSSCALARSGVNGLESAQGTDVCFPVSRGHEYALDACLIVPPLTTFQAYGG